MVYESRTGRILHIHQCVSAAGRAHPEDDELESSAFRYAAEAGHPDRSLAVLHVNPQSLQSGRNYKVDVETRALVEAS